MAVVTPTDRSKSVRNRCVIEVFGGVLCSHVPFLIFLFCRGFCYRTESDLFIFFCHNNETYVVSIVSEHEIS